MFHLDDGKDSGDIISQIRISVFDDDYSSDLYNKMIDGGIRLIKRELPKIIIKSSDRIKQNEDIATEFSKPPKDINKIDLDNESLEYIYKKIRALSKPYRGAYIEKDGRKLIIWKAELI